MPAVVADFGKINSALSSWRQGDVCLADKLDFVHLADLTQPLSTVAKEIAQQSGDDAQPLPEPVGAQVLGLVVTSQTCDIVRDCEHRHYVEVSPVIEVSEQVYKETISGRRVGYAVIKELADKRIVADLDRTMTLEKSVLASWKRTPGWKMDADVRAFGDALARRRNRFAFPDDFVEDFIKAFHARIAKRHGKNSDEGKFLNALREIRVRAAASWNSPKTDLEFWFIRNNEPEGIEDTSKGWHQWVAEWIDLLPKKHAKYRCSWHQICNLEDMTARDYVESDRLDFDRLSE